MTGTPRDSTGDDAARISIAAFVALDDAGREAHLLRHDRPDAEILRLGDAAERMAADDPSTAARMLGELRRACGADAARASGRARASRGEVLALSYLGRFEEAIDLASAARNEAASRGVAIEAARLRLAAMQPLLKLGRSEEAIREGERAAEELAAGGETALVARARINLGNVLKAVGRSAEALAQLDAALPAVAGEGLLEATIENTRGEALLQLDRFDDARAAFARAITRFAADSQAFAWAVAEGNLADLAARSGDLAEAFERFAAARERLPEQAAGHAARLLLEEGEVFEASGLLEVAIDRLRTAAKRLAELGLAFEQCRAGVALARAHLGAGLDEEALAALAGIPTTTGGDRIASQALAIEAVARSRIAVRSGEDSDRKAAAAAADRLAAAIAGGGLSLDRIISLDRLARALEHLDRSDAAIATAREASEAAEAMGLATAIGSTAATRARLARRAGLRLEAEASARRAVDAVERTRASFGADRLRSAFLGTRLAAYEELVLALVERGGDEAIEEAFAVAELARSRTLVERLLQPFSAPPSADDPEIARLRERLQGLHARLASIARDDARSVAIDPLRVELVEVESMLERRLSERAGAAATRRDAAAAPPDRAWRRSLQEDQRFIEYFEASGRLLAFVATRESVAVIRLPGSLGEIEGLVAKLHFRIRRRLRSSPMPLPDAAVEIESLLDRLAERLWSPLRHAIGDAMRAVVAPHGCLHALPFAAIADRGGVGVRSISIVPAARLWTRLAGGEEEPADGDLLIVGVSDAAAPRIGEEIHGIAAAVPPSRRVRILEGAAATASAVLAQLADPRVSVAHLACHGQFLPEAPHASGLRMHDRWISVREIARLRRVPATVLLSGCDTGSVAVMPGEELLGVPRALLATGARRIVGSLWSVGDRDACGLMVDLHRLWSTVDSEGRPPSLASALAAAQRIRRAATSHPAHWASFVAIGDAS